MERELGHDMADCVNWRCRAKGWLIGLAAAAPWAYLAVDRVLHFFGLCIGG